MLNSKVLVATVVLLANTWLMVNSAFASSVLPVIYDLVWESEQITKVPIAIIYSIDLNQNRIKELLVTDFSLRNSTLHQNSPNPRFIIFEWNGKQMELKWEKNWEAPEADGQKKYTMVNKIKEIIGWVIGSRTIVESFPPYISIQWENGKYKWKEQYEGNDAKTKIVGSWVFPFLSPVCYGIFNDGKLSYPYECLYGVRNFASNGVPRVATRFEDKDRTILRIRKLAEGFPIEDESIITGGLFTPLDPFNEDASSGLLFVGGLADWYFVSPKAGTRDYLQVPIMGNRKALGPPENNPYKAGTTQKKDQWEYWGFRWIKGEDGKDTNLFSKIYIDKSKGQVFRDDVEFPIPENFLGIGDFALEDLDDDQLDEIIFVASIGKRRLAGEKYLFSEISDRIYVMKWNGKAYKIIWSSPPIKKKWSKILIGDVLGNGKNQIVVGTGEGTIQIWEKK